MKILIDIHQGIGDVIHCLPLIENARHTYPDAYIIILLNNRSNTALLSDNLYDEIVIWRELDFNYIIDLRRKRIDLAFLNVVTNMYKGVFFLKQIVGVRTVVSEYAFSARTGGYVFVKQDPNMHRVDRNLRLSDLWGLQRKKSIPDLTRRVEEIRTKGFISKAKINPDGKGIIGICMGSGATGARKFLKTINKNVKQWPVNNVVNLCSKLTDDRFILYIFGGAAEKEMGKAVSASKSPFVVDYTGECTLEETMDLVSRCDLCVGVDTGIMHMAAALNIPTVALFGPTNPEQFAPYSSKNVNITAGLKCQYCYGKKEMAYCEDNCCMNRIEADEVYETCLDSLKTFS